MTEMKKRLLYLFICAFVLIASGCGNGEKSNYDQDVYAETIDKLSEGEFYAVIETNVDSPVLLVTSLVYDDGNGNQASIMSDVYYLVDGKVQNIGTVESLGTAYPITYDKTGIYTASGHNMQRYEIDEKEGTLVLAEGVYETFDESGNATYTRETASQSETIDEEAYLSAAKSYGNAAVVNFGHGQ